MSFSLRRGRRSDTLLADVETRGPVDVLKSVLATGRAALKSSVTGPRADQDAITAGLTVQWSSAASRETSPHQDAEEADARTHRS